MKTNILGFIASHYVGSFGRECLLSIRDHCDKVYICHSIGTSQGFNTDLTPPETSIEIYNLAKEILEDKLIWEEYPSFPNESEHRRMKYRYTAGFSYCLSVDWDEVIQNIPEAIKYAEQNEERFYGARGFKHFWKGNSYYFSDDHAPIRLEKLTVANLDQNLNLPLEVFHYSLSQSPSIMEYKLKVSGHRDEFRSDFYDKWLNWSEDKIDEITDLHPTLPEFWHKPTLYTGELPKFIQSYKPKPKEMIKILYIPLDFQRHKESPELFTDTINSLNRLSTCKIFDGNLADALLFKPDVILFQGSMSWTDLTSLKLATKALVLMWTGDCRYAPFQSLVDYKEIVDGYLLPFSGTLLNTYQSILGKPCFFLWESIQDWRFKVPKMMEDGDVTFVGNVYDTLPGGESRLQLREFLNVNGIYGNFKGNGFQTEINNGLVPDLYNNSYIVIAENNHTVEDYFTPRNLGGLSAGSCTLMKYFPGIEKFFQNLVHCIYYSNKYELLSWIEHLKSNPEFRNKISSQGFGLANEKFKMENWSRDLMYIITKHYIK